MVREAVLNAVSHRDYRHGGSIFVRQYSRRIEIVSPGGFPAGITPENVLRQQNPRNRRIAEVLGKCGLVERAGQGFDRIFRECIQQSKPLPDFSHTDDHFVWLTHKELLLKHIQDNRKEGSQLRELRQVLPALSYVQVQKLLQELRIKGQIHKVGNTSAARWYPGGIVLMFF